MISMRTIPDYEPTDPGFRLDIAGFWIIPDANSKTGKRVEPIPNDVFMSYLDSLSDDE